MVRFGMCEKWGKVKLLYYFYWFFCDVYLEVKLDCWCDMIIKEKLERFLLVFYEMIFFYIISVLECVMKRFEFFFGSFWENKMVYF